MRPALARRTEGPTQHAASSPPPLPRPPRPRVALQQAAELLPSISGLLAGVNLPSIPLVNFDLDNVKVPVMEASDQLQGLLADSEHRRRQEGHLLGQCGI